jgi:tetratricopeptide (TPR) repeat protein
MIKRLFFAAVWLFPLAAYAQTSEGVPSSPAEAVGAPAVSPVREPKDRGTEIRNLWAAGERKMAWKRANAWINREGNSAEAWTVGAELFYREGKYKKALSYAKKAISRSPQYADAYYVEGQAYEALKNPMDAANEYRAAMAAKKDFSEAKEALDRVMAQLDPSAGGGAVVVDK